jgi:galactose oxidase
MSGCLFSRRARRPGLLIQLYLFWTVLLCTNAVAQTPDPSVVGQWSSVFSLPYKAVHTSLLPTTGKVLYWPSFTLGDNPEFLNPSNNSSSAATKAGWNIFCSGHAFMATGKLFVAGGHSNSCPYGLPNAAIFDPSLNSWTQLPKMNQGRWYPTVTTLANGDMLVLAGTVDPNTGSDTLPQIWQQSSNSWRNLTTALLSMPQYPRVFLAPNGKVVSVGPYSNTRYLDTSGTGKWTTGSKSLYGTRDYGSAVMYDSGKVLIVGGGDPPTATAEIINLNASTPTWSYTGSMAHRRRQLNATILPDGTVFVSGGSSSSGFDNSSTPVLPTEMWNPATGRFTTMASISVYRGYHSTATLLTDGRVLSAGGEKSPNTAEIFSPPYLFTGSRPTITGAPASGTWGQTISITTPDAASIAKVSLIRFGSTTHAFNMNQRLNFLSFQITASGLNVTLPANANLAPPGHYMLFILNGSGVPSTAAVIQIS